MFKVWDHSSFKRDHLVAETEADVYSVLEKNGGKCSDVLVSLDMFLIENIHSGEYSTVDKYVYSIYNKEKTFAYCTGFLNV